MRIKWYGTASLLIEGGTTRILVDPFFSVDATAERMQEAASVQAAVITHPHYEQFSGVKDLVPLGLNLIYVSESGITIAQENNIPDDGMFPISKNEKFQIGEITVQTFASCHGKYDWVSPLSVFFSPRTYRHLKRTVQTLHLFDRYQIERDDILALEFSHEGKQIMVLGSAGMDENTEYPQNADLLVVPYSGRANMYRHMTKILQEFMPKQLMIDRFENALPPFTRRADTEKLQAVMKEQYPKTKLLIPAPNEWYEI